MKPEFRPLIRLPIRFIIAVIILLLCLFCFAQTVSSEQKKEKNDVTITVTKEEMPDDKIFYGTYAEKITNPRCFDKAALLSMTPEWKEIKSKKIDKGTGKYWILLSAANDRADKQVNTYTQDAELEFLCDRETLFNVLKKMEQFKSVSEKALIAEFDVTDSIAKFNLKPDKADAPKKGFAIEEQLGGKKI
jgi:hypothetical protein